MPKFILAKSLAQCSRYICKIYRETPNNLVDSFAFFFYVRCLVKNNRKSPQTLTYINFCSVAITAFKSSNLHDGLVGTAVIG